ncbi:MAG: transglycosylase domain-containing protein [Cyanobacteriota bacterium]
MTTDDLVIHQPGAEPRRIGLHGQVYRIGRDPQAEVVIPHPAVSKRHALLQRRGRRWLLTDAGSTNGLSWRGRRLQELELQDGDRIRLGPLNERELPELEFRSGRRSPPWLSTAGRGLLVLVLGGAGMGLAVLGLGVLQAPVRGNLAPIRGPLAIYDHSNRLLASVNSSEHRELPGLDHFAPVLIEALLSSEDTRFWWHPGIDPIGTGRALVTNLIGGRVLEGGSTLTQQLARSLYPEQVGQGETLGRKWRELLVALQLEARFSKRDLLLSYLNRVYLGAGWGFEDAARHYFDRPARALSLEQAALLVGLLPSPNGHDPCQFPSAAQGARNAVLNKMVAEGRLHPDAARRAMRTTVVLAPKACAGQARRPAPYYTDQVLRDLEAMLGTDTAAQGNFLVETYLDPVLQDVVETTLRNTLRDQGWGARQGAVAVLDSRSGGILALAGGRDYDKSQFNRATQALRQPGSTFKLMTYLVAIERGLRPGSPVSCAPVDWGGQHFEAGCGGSLSLTQAFAHSSNTAALRLARRYGLEAVIRKARDLGISTPMAAVPGLVLGQSETHLLEMTAAYGAVANDGLWRAPTTIRRLTDAETCPAGRSTCRRMASPVGSGRRVLPTGDARVMQGLLRAVVQSGTGTAASLGGEEGGKTGTTNDGRDLLFIGYDPRRHWVMGVWLGNDDNSPTGSTSALAAQLWGEIIRNAGRGSTTAETRG